MRIAFFSDNFYPELSGITDTILTTTTELKKRGHEILYVAPYYAPADWKAANKESPQTAEADMVAGSRIVRLPAMRAPMSPTGQSRMAYPWGVVPRELLDFKPDIVHTHSPYGIGLAAVRAARYFSVPLVGTNHTAIDDFFPIGTRDAMRLWEAHYYNHCAFMSAPYANLIMRMRDMGFKKPGRAVPNPADLHEFSVPSAESRAEHRKAFGVTGPTLIYIGRLGVEKRVDVMVRAVPHIVKALPTFTFLATGHGAARPALEKLAKELGVASHVRFTGYLSRVGVTHLCKAGDVFGMTSTSDSQSLALMQAYASGLPAILARARGLPDYAPADCSYLVEPGDHEAFAQKFIQLFDGEGHVERMGAAAAAYVKQFAPEKIADEWEQIYSDAISSL